MVPFGTKHMFNMGPEDVCSLVESVLPMHSLGSRKQKERETKETKERSIATCACGLGDDTGG